MGSDLFAPWHIIILVVVLVILFGAKRLPGAANSLGQSMHIFKKSVQGLHPDDSAASAANPDPSDRTAGSWATTPPAVAAPDATQQQLIDLQRQVQDLQRQSAASNGQPSEAQTTRPI
jgi:sec-independent protein translocase protein TatA